MLWCRQAYVHQELSLTSCSPWSIDQEGQQRSCRERFETWYHAPWCCQQHTWACKHSTDRVAWASLPERERPACWIF